jgi:hypothetical protein
MGHIVHLNVLLSIYENYEVNHLLFINLYLNLISILLSFYEDNQMLFLLDSFHLRIIFYYLDCNYY